MSPSDLATDVVRRLRAAGFEALWAGGCVRDQLLGIVPKDYDVATSAVPGADSRRLRPPQDAGDRRGFGVITVLGPRSAGQIDVATFRRDAAYSDGRHPDSVSFTTAEAGCAPPRLHHQRPVLRSAGRPGDRLCRRAGRPAAGNRPGDRRPAAALRRGQAADAAGRAVCGPFRLRPRRAHAGRDSVPGPRTGHRERRTDRGRNAADPHPHEPGPRRRDAPVGETAGRRATRIGCPDAGRTLVTRVRGRYSLAADAAHPAPPRSGGVCGCAGGAIARD